jgi:hypothetical protein
VANANELSSELQFAILTAEAHLSIKMQLGSLTRIEYQFDKSLARLSNNKQPRVGFPGRVINRGWGVAGGMPFRHRLWNESPSILKARLCNRKAILF